MWKSDELLQHARVLQWRRVSWIAAGVLGLIAVLGFLLAPPLVSKLIQEQASKTLGRTVTLERVRINPFALSATVDGLRIAENGNQGDFVSVARIYANVEFTSLFRLSLVLGQLRVDKPQVRVVRLAEQRFNFSDILDHLAKQPKDRDASPLHFSLNNIELTDGRIEFDDRPAGQKHLIDKMALGLPFVSNIPSQVQLFVNPHLEFDLNGSSLALEGKIKPFADRREASLALEFEKFDLVRYLGYSPVTLPVTISRAMVGAKLECVWTERAKGGNALSLRGDVELSDVQVNERGGAALLGFKALQLGLQDVQPITSPMQIALRSVSLRAPELSVHRFADGRLNLQALAVAPPAVVPTVASAPAATAARKAPAPVVTVARLAIEQGRLNWRDDAVEGGFKTSIKPFNMQVQGFDLAGMRDATVTADLQLESTGKISAQGSFNAAKTNADVKLTLGELMLASYQPYYAKAIGGAKPTAQVDLATRLQFSAPSAGGVRLSEGTLTLKDLSLPERAKSTRANPILTLQALTLAGVALDMEKRSVVLDQIRSRGAQLRLVRDANGQLNLLQTLGVGSRADVSATPVVATRDIPAEVAKDVAREVAAVRELATPSSSWQVRTGKGELRDWNVSLEDRRGKTPVSITVSQLALTTEGFSTEPGTSGHVDLNAQVNRQGRLRLAGRIGLSPLSGALRLDAKALDLLFTQPYVSSMARVLVTQGALDARGDVGFNLSDANAPRFSYQGDVAVNNFNSFDQINETDFVRWKRFVLSKLDVQTAPQRFAVNEVRLEDFYSRLILDAQGRFNLREMTNIDRETVSTSTSTPAQSVPLKKTSAPDTQLPPPKPTNLRIDQVLVSGGNINFSDRFIKPNYDANLTDVTGSLKGLSSDQKSLADLSIKALVDHAAPVDVSGQLNPLRQDKYLDIKARVSGVDLTSVSPYATRYAGYGIVKGKLSMDLGYRINDRKLTASNKVYLDQLTFGERVDSPEATKLPVLLAVALLKDRNGVIDIDLPISGTLDDPEFSVGGIIVRVLVNLISKAVTAPFSLLGAAFGGGEELSYVDFNPGITVLSKSAEERLATLARALSDRPGLTLEVAGVADATTDVPGLKRALLANKMRAIKADAMVKRGESVGEVDALAITADEYPRLLEQVYRRESFDKPKNAIGMSKGLSVAEMEKLIFDNSKLGEADLHALANRRAQVVRDWLLTQGKVPSARVFVIEGKSAAADSTAKLPPARADFSLK